MCKRAGMSMRFSDYSLYKRTDEPLRPAEKSLKDRFLSNENTHLVYIKALSDVDRYVSYSDVTATMDAVFRLAILTTGDLPLVSHLNSVVIRKLSDATERSESVQKRFADRVFHNSNFPKQLLPRPSYSSHSDEDQDQFTRW